MSTTRTALRSLPRPVRSVPLPGGASLHVRGVSLAELREVDRRAELLPAGPDREIRRLELLCAYALAEPDGAPAFAEVLDADLLELGHLTPDQMEAVATASMPTKADAKNA